MSILTVGSVAFDSIETPFGKADRIVGGAATYICWAASYFVDDIKLCSVIGGDFPEDELNELRGRGVSTEGLEVKQDEKSFFWSGKYHDDMNGRDTLLTELNVLADFDPVLPDSYKNCDYVMLGNLTPEVQLNVINQMDKRPKLIVLDTMNFWMDVALDSLKAVIAKVDVLTINDEEARQLSGEHSLVKAARAIRAMGPKYLVIKKGEHGALLFHGENIFFAPALPLESVFDPTGAGDTFAGGFIGHLAKTDDLSFENMKRAVIFGSLMASCTVEKFGIEKLKGLSTEELQARMEQFSNLTRFDAAVAF